MRTAYNPIIRSIVALLIIAGVVACSTTAARKGDTPSNAASIGGVKEVAVGLGENASKIDDARKRAEAKAPEVAPESAEIGTQTNELRAKQRQLELIQRSLLETEQHIKELQADLDKMGDQVAAKDEQIAKLQKNLEEIKTSGVRKMLLALAAASVVGVVVSIWLLKSIQIAAVCATGFAVSVGGTYLLAYANWLALGVGVILLGSIAWAAWRLMQSHGELVKTAEVFKNTPPDQKDKMTETASAIQSEFTRRLVKPIRDRAKKTAAGLSAFIHQ